MPAIASRDFGGGRYGIYLGDGDNKTTISLPDGNRLTFKYNDFSRPIEETDPLGRSITCSYHLSTTLITETAFPGGSVWKAPYDD